MKLDTKCNFPISSKTALCKGQQTTVIYHLIEWMSFYRSKQDENKQWTQ